MDGCSQIAFAFYGVLLTIHKTTKKLWGTLITVQHSEQSVTAQSMQAENILGTQQVNRIVIFVLGNENKFTNQS